MALSLRGKKRVLNLAAAVCLLMAPVVLWWGLGAFPDWQPAAELATPASRSAATAVLFGEPQNSLAVPDDPDVWTRRLRRPLYDPPPPKVVERTLPPLQVVLLGTILESGNSKAIVSASGKVEYKRVGEMIGPADSPAQIVEILGDSIVIRRENETTTLKRKEE